MWLDSACLKVKVLEHKVFARTEHVGFCGGSRFHNFCALSFFCRLYFLPLFVEVPSIANSFPVYMHVPLDQEASDSENLISHDMMELVASCQSTPPPPPLPPPPPSMSMSCFFFLMV